MKNQARILGTVLTMHCHALYDSPHGYQETIANIPQKASE